jgi:hypothetical protein
MAHAETLHARVLERMRTRLDSAVLNSPVDAKVLRQAQEALRHEVVAAAGAVTDLEDAYQLAHEIENSEINTVVEFLVTSFPENPAPGEFLREQSADSRTKIDNGFSRTLWRYYCASSSFACGSFLRRLSGAYYANSNYRGQDSRTRDTSTRH